MITDDLPRDLDQLAAIGRTPDVTIRPILLRVMVDLFTNKPHHADVEIRQFEEILSHILDDVDDETRFLVAEKLVRHPQTPKSLLTRLIATDGTAAQTVITHAAIDPATLMATAAFGPTDLAVATAKRSDLDGATVRSLAERPEPEVLHALANNLSAPIDIAVLRYLARRARTDQALAGKLLERPGAKADSAVLFFAANPAQRAQLIADARRRDLGASNHTLPVTVSVHALAAIERASNRRGVEELDTALASLLELSRADIEQIMDDLGGEPMALALAAVGISPETAGRIFILGDPSIGHSYGRVKALVAIVASVPPRAAYRLVMSMLGRSSEVLRRSASPASADHEPRRGFGFGAVARPQPAGAELPFLQFARRSR